MAFPPGGLEKRKCRTIRVHAKRFGTGPEPGQSGSCRRGLFFRRTFRSGQRRDKGWEGGMKTKGDSGEIKEQKRKRTTSLRWNSEG